ARAFAFSAARPGTYLSAAADYPTLAAAGRPLLIMPGNHDRYQGARTMFAPGDTKFDEAAYFGKSWPAGPGVHHFDAIPPACAHLGVTGPGSTLTAGDNGAWAGLGHFGRGRVYDNRAGNDDRIQRLVDLTDQARAKYAPCAILWVIHFEPEAADTTLELRDED